MTDVDVYFSFMYTGRLEFRTELHKRLYTTAQQMNMTVLTKLLDAQNAATSPQVKPVIRRPPQVPITYNLQGKKIIPKQIDTDLPETLPGRKYVIRFNPLACSSKVFLTHYTAQGQVLCNCFFFVHLMYRKILKCGNKLLKTLMNSFQGTLAIFPSVLPQNLVLHCYCLFWYFFCENPLFCSLTQENWTNCGARSCLRSLYKSNRCS